MPRNEACIHTLKGRFRLRRTMGWLTQAMGPREGLLHLVEIAA